MPIDRIKIDRSFIQRIESSPDERIILEAIVALGHKLGFNIVAEGIEQESQLHILRELKVDTVQGYYSRPLDEEALVAYLGDFQLPRSERN